jgi:nitroreductase
MMNAAHALDLGSCPITGFSRGGAAVVLDLPSATRAELILMLGHPAASASRPGAVVERIDLNDIIDWEYPRSHA